MHRRQFISLACCAAVWPFRSLAQQAANPPLVALINPFTADRAAETIAALRLGLKQAGLIEGTHYAFAARFANSDYARLPELAKELDALKPRVFVVMASATAIAAARKQAPNTPLVFAAIAADPIGLGWAESYAKPGGMITGGVMNAVGGEESLTSKRIGFFKELVPGLTRLGMICEKRPRNSASSFRTTTSEHSTISMLRFRQACAMTSAPSTSQATRE
jgi:ABC-type uncharacterized transport system substrate-binding protein